MKTIIPDRYNPDSGYYRTVCVESMAEVRQLFPNGQADEFNWCFCSTSGVHGWYTTLDTLEFSEEYAGDKPEYPRSVTILIVQPRIVRTYFGHLDVTMDDIRFLRQLVETTLAIIPETQKGNRVHAGTAS